MPKDRIEILKRKKEWVRKIEELGNVKLKINELVEVEGEPLDVYRAQNVLKALARGFHIDDALFLLDEQYRLEIINVKQYAKTRERMVELKGRVIGTKGKFKRIIEEFTGTKIAVHGKTISIIGRWEDVELARQAIDMILRGAQHQTVYRFLELHRTH